jgi:hypothetical protein
LSCCFRPSFPVGDCGRTSGRASCSFPEVYCPMWCGEYRRSVVCVSVLCRSWTGNIHGKIHMVGMLLSSMVFLSPVRNERCTPASVAPNARCLEGLLLVFDSGYSGVSILVADDHLPGPRTILKDFLQISFVIAGLNLPLCAKFLRLWSPQSDSLLLAWELRQEFNNVQQRILFVTGKDIQGFSPILLNEIKMDA